MWSGVSLNTHFLQSKLIKVSNQRVLLAFFQHSCAVGLHNLTPHFPLEAVTAAWQILLLACVSLGVKLQLHVMSSSRALLYNMEPTVNSKVLYIYNILRR